MKQVDVDELIYRGAMANISGILGDRLDERLWVIFWDELTCNRVGIMLEQGMEIDI